MSGRRCSGVAKDELVIPLPLPCTGCVSAARDCSELPENLSGMEIVFFIHA